MQHFDPKQPSDDAFDDQPTGNWRVIDAAQPPVRQDEIEDEQLEPDELMNLAG